MSVAKVTEIIASSSKSFDDAVKNGIERANKTLQDRLVKELRLQGISTIAAGNQVLPGFLANYNARFGQEPYNPKNLHRPLSTGDDLADVFAGAKSGRFPTA